MAGGIEIRRVRTAEELERAFEIRREVFVIEQRIPSEQDFDDKDQIAHHVLVLIGGRAVATGRVLLETSGHATLARIAVLREFRGASLGPIVVNELETIAREHGSSRLSLHPHLHLERFYGALGYNIVPGTESSVGEHRLITMSKTIDAADGRDLDAEREEA